jgi:hypothetical protein
MTNTAIFLFCALANLNCAIALGRRYVVLENGYHPLMFLVSIAIASVFIQNTCSADQTAREAAGGSR